MEMRVLRLGGKASSVSNLTMVSKFFNWVSSLSETQMVDCPGGSVKLGFRCFSSISSNIQGVNSRNVSESNDFKNDGNDDKFLFRDGGEIDNRNGPPQPIPGRPLRGERQMPQFNQRQNVSRGRDKPWARDGGGAPLSSHQKFANSLGRGGDEVGKRTDFSSVDKFGDGDEGKRDVGFGGDNVSRKDSRASINDLFNSSSKAVLGNGQEERDFLEKFKLSGNEKKESHLGNVTSATHEEEKEEPPQDADFIFKKMKESGLIPNAVAMLDGLCKDGLVQEAMKLFGLMREKGTMPEVVIYTAVVDGFCQAHKFDDAKRIFRKMQTNGITPNAFSYAVLIKGLYKCRRLEDAVDFSVEMLEAGHSLNVATFTELVDVFCKEKGVEEARKVIDALKQKGFFLDEKAVRDHLNKKGPRSSMVWEAIFGPRKSTQTSS